MMTDLKKTIRDVYDFPKKGIVFKDITTLLKDAKAFRETIDAMCEPFHEPLPEAIVGIESRGFIFGSAMAYRLGIPFVPVRKPGKLPAETVREEYTLEYGKDAIEMHRDAIRESMRVLIVDDLLATGGTAAATVRLVQKLNGIVVGTVFLIELAFLNGRDLLKNVPVHTVISYSAE
jgi:adenine phosphoribosyltransferase